MKVNEETTTTTVLVMLIIKIIEGQLHHSNMNKTYFQNKHGLIHPPTPH